MLRYPLQVALLVYFAAKAGGWLEYWRWYGEHALQRTDLAQYYSLSLTGFRFGWASLYNFQDELQTMASLGALIPFPNVETPAVAWLAAPLSGLDLSHAYLVWSLLLFVAILCCAWLSAPDGLLLKAVLVAAAIPAYPLLLSLILGQTTALLMAAVAGSYALLTRKLELAAGLVLGAVLALHPQSLALVPAALLLAGRWRAFAGAVGTLLAVAVAAALQLGPDGVHAYLSRLLFADQHASVYMVTRHIDLLAHLQNNALRVMFEAGVIAVTLLAAWQHRREGVELPIAAGLVGSLLAAPYLHLYDLAMLVPAVWLAMRASPALLASALVVVTYGVLYLDHYPLSAAAGAVTISLEAIWLLCSVTMTRSSRRLTAIGS
ncbi:MAG: glycosyltransferase family 87 protein [Candidatus Dormibacterales bacterium]